MERITRAACALGINMPQGSGRYVRHILIWSLLLFGAQVPVASAATFSSASIALSDPRPGQTASYTFTGSSVSLTAINCIKVVWSNTSGGTTAPTGFDGTGGSVTAASSTLINSSATGWSLATSDGASSTGQDNVWQYTNASGVTPGGASGRTLLLAGITNSSITDTTYYFKINTYGNTNCSSSPIDDAVLQFINTNGSLVSLTIDPTLSFSVNAVGTSTSCNGTTTTQASTATTIGFGSVTTASNGVVCQDLIPATNSTSGYTISARYTGAPTSGIDTIADHSGTNASPTIFSSAGTEAYGYSTNDTSLGTGTANRFTNGGQKWAAMTTANNEVAYEASGAASTTYRIGHQVGISVTTPGGIYQTTIIYTCTPIY